MTERELFDMFIGSFPEAKPSLVCWWWDEILDHYAQPHRHYHTLDHILHVVDLLGNDGGGAAYGGSSVGSTAARRCVLRASRPGIQRARQRPVRREDADGFWSLVETRIASCGRLRLPSITN